MSNGASKGATSKDERMTPHEERLLELLRQRSLTLGEFRLASGGTSNYYIDGRMTTVFSEGAFLIGQVLYERTRDLNIDAIGGLAVGAVPLTTAAVLVYHTHGRRMEGFWVRNEPKRHGTRKLIEGGLRKGSRVVIVDDVITRGESALKAVQEVRALGGEVVLITALVDRLAGARELFLGEGISCFEPVFTIRDLGVAVDERTPPAATARKEEE
jgi:orotate phosphoribosyltransferase